MSSKKKRKKKLRKMLAKRELADSLALVICVGKKCGDRNTSREVLHEARAYAEATRPLVHIVATGCLHICKKGPLAATYPIIKFHKRVDADDARRLVDRIARSDD